MLTVNYTLLFILFYFYSYACPEILCMENPTLNSKVGLENT